MASIQITSTNYNGQVAQVTFYSVNAPNTPVNLGPQTLPYSRSGDDVYGSYELNFTAYNKWCYAVLDGTTTTTTTTTAAPTTTTTTTTTTTAAPTTTTTTTTTAAPGGVTGFTMSGTGWNVSNGFNLCPAGNYDGVSYYLQTDGPTRIMFREASYWYVDSGTQPGTANFGAPPIAFVESNASTPPLTGWGNGGTLTQTNCGGTTTTTTTTTTAAPTTTTTTTTSAPAGCDSTTGVCLSVTGGYSQSVLSVDNTSSNKPVVSSAALGACGVDGVLAQLTVNTTATGTGDFLIVELSSQGGPIDMWCGNPPESSAGVVIVKKNGSINGVDMGSWDYSGGGNAYISCKNGDVITVEATVPGIKIPGILAYGYFQPGNYIGCPAFIVSGSSDSTMNGTYRAQGSISNSSGLWSIPDNDGYIFYNKINNDGSVDASRRIHYYPGPDQWTILKDYWTIVYTSTTNQGNSSPNAAFAANVPTTNWYAGENVADITVAAASSCSGFIKY